MVEPGFPPEEIAVLVSGGSRAGRAWAEGYSIEQMRSFAYWRVVDPARPSRSAVDPYEEAVALAVRAGAKVIAVAGGDGSLRRAVPAIIANNLILGILPTGTGNSLGHEVGVPLDPSEALASLSKPGSIVEVDTGRVSDDTQSTPFLTVASLGLTGSIARRLDKTNKAMVGRLAYVPAVIQALGQMRPFDIRIEAGGSQFEGSVMLCVIAVTATHGGPFSPHPEAKIDDGLLSVYVVEKTGLGGLGAFAVALATGTHTHLPMVWSAHAATVKVETERKRDVILDGDPVRFRNFQATSQHRDLKIYVHQTLPPAVERIDIPLPSEG